VLFCATPFGVEEIDVEYYHSVDEIEIAELQDTSAAPSTNVEEQFVAAAFPNATYDTDPVTGLPLLHSDTNANTSIYLDFDGGSYNGTTYTSYDTDGNPSTFSASEANDILLAWEDVSTYYAMFDVDVTTVKPDVLNVPTAWIVLSGTNNSGNAIQGSYTFSYNQTVATGLVGGGAVRNKPYVLAHELGHIYGLQHQGEWDTTPLKTREYAWAVDGISSIMGSDTQGSVFNGWTISTWSRSPSFFQDDATIIAAAILEESGSGYTGDGYRQDDYGGNLLTPTLYATALTENAGTWYTDGIIERLNDVDTFSFNWSGGYISLDAHARAPVVSTTLFDYASSVALDIYVFDSSGTLVGYDDPTGPTDSQWGLDMNLAAGTYYVVLKGHGDTADFGIYDLNISATTGSGLSQPIIGSWDVAALVSENPSGDYVNNIILGLANDDPTSTSVVVDRSTDGVNWTQVYSQSGYQASRTFTDTNITRGETYFYRYGILGGSGGNRYSNSIIVHSAPKAVTNLTGTPWKTDAVILTWTEVSGDSGYLIEQSTDGVNFTEAGRALPNYPSYTVDQLSASTTYTFRVSTLSDNPSATPASAQIVIATPATSDPNSVPQAQDDIVAKNGDASITIDVVANDTDPDGDTLAILNTTARDITHPITQPKYGKAVATPNNITYTPNAGYTGGDSFVYAVWDNYINNADPVNTTHLGIDYGTVTILDNQKPIIANVIVNTTGALGSTITGESVSVAQQAGGITSIEIIFSEEVNFSEVFGEAVVVTSSVTGLPIKPDWIKGTGTNTLTLGFTDTAVTGTGLNVSFVSGSVIDNVGFSLSPLRIQSAIADLTVLENASNSVIDLSGVFIDAYGAPITNLSLTSNTNPSLVGTALVGTNLTLSYSPNSYGTADITVRGTDSGGSWIEDTFTVNVQAISPKLASGVVTVDSGVWTTINLEQTYQSMVVVATVVSPDNTQPPMVTRIDNASGSSFDLMLQRIDNLTGTVSGVQVQYMVIEEGVYTAAQHGFNVEAFKINSTLTNGRNNWGTSQSVGYQNSYAAPVVVGQVMSYNDTRQSVFWTRGSSSTNAPNSTNLHVGKHVGEDPVTARNNETLGYIVFESGTGTLDGVTFTAGVTTDTIQGIDDPGTYTYAISGLTNPTSAVLTQAAVDGNDGGFAVLRGPTPLTASQITMNIDEDKLLDTERAHTTEQVAFVVFDALPLTPKLVSDVVTVNSGVWTTIQLGKTYQSMVVVATVVVANASQPPMVTRINNASGSSFDLLLQRFDNLTSTVSNVQVHYMVIEEGVYTAAEHGFNAEAVKVTSTITNAKNNWTTGQAASYQNSYAAPVVVGQVMSYNDTRQSVFWARGSAASEIPNSTNLYVGKHVGEDPATTRLNETLGYIVFETGTGTLGGVTFTAGVTTDTIQGVENGTYTYGITGLTAPTSAVLSSAAIDGADGAFAVLRGPTPVTATQLTLNADEDAMSDTERAHTTEQIAFVVFEGPGTSAAPDELTAPSAQEKSKTPKDKSMYHYYGWLQWLDEKQAHKNGTHQEKYSKSKPFSTDSEETELSIFEI